MSNDFFNPSGNPGTGSQGLSSIIRTEFSNISAGFDKMPPLTGNGSRAVVINPGGTGLAVTTGTFALAGNFSTTGAFNTVLAQTASVTLTLPAVSGTLATLAGTETLSNKTLVAPALGTPASGVATNLTGTATALNIGGNAATATAATSATTATNVSGGTASVTTLAASSTVSGAGFTARFSSPGPIGDSAASTGAFTTLSATSTVSGTGFDAYLASGKPASFTTLAASSTVSGAGFDAYLASGKPGSFSTLAASSTVSGAGFDAYLASGKPAAHSTLSASSTVSGAGFDAYIALGTKPASFTTLSSSSAATLAGRTDGVAATSGNVGQELIAQTTGGSSTVTITLASPGVITWTAHGLSELTGIVLSTSGALPTGLATGTNYWITAGSVTANTFTLSTSMANAVAGTAINTSVSQSGTQTAFSTLNLVSGTQLDIAAINVPAGEWEVSASTGSVIAVGGVTTTSISGWVSATAHTVPSPFGGNSSAASWFGSVLNAAPLIALPGSKLRLSVATVVYLQQLSQFSGGAFDAGGSLRVRRVQA